MNSISPGARRRQDANVGIGILIFLSICLCGLCVFQWMVQSRLRNMVEQERIAGNKLKAERQDFENKSRRYADEIAHITELKASLEADKKSNSAALRTANNELVRLRSDYQYTSNAFVQVTNSLMIANSNIVFLNKQVQEWIDRTKKSMDERNEIVNRFNEKARQYGELVTNYNALAAQYEDFQNKVKAMLEKQNEKK